MKQGSGCNTSRAYAVTLPRLASLFGLIITLFFPRKQAQPPIGTPPLCASPPSCSRTATVGLPARPHRIPPCAARPLRWHRYCDPLAVAHDAEHLCKFEELVEAAVDLDRVPDEYLIAPAYRDDLQVRASASVCKCVYVCVCVCAQMGVCTGKS